MADEDPKTSKGVFVPVAANEQGDIRGMYFGEDGVGPRQFTPVQDDSPMPEGDYTVMSSKEGQPFFETQTYHTGRRGPAKYNNDAYREGWERIWGKKEAGEA
jgi:hypothetical protein